MNEGRSLDNTQVREIVANHINTLNEKIDQWHKDLPTLKTRFGIGVPTTEAYGIRSSVDITL